MIKIEVIEVRGRCPVHKVGDKIVIDGARILLDKTDAYYAYMPSQLYFIMQLY